MRHRPVGRVAALIATLFLGAAELRGAGAPKLTIGILSVRPKEETRVQWQPLADELGRSLGTHGVEVRTLDYAELEDALAGHELDFVLTNPSHYIRLRYLNGLSGALATLIPSNGGAPVSAFGGVIVARSDRNDISRLDDIRGRTVAIVSTDSIGGFQGPALVLREAGILLPGDARLRLTGLPHDRVVAEVLEGKADVGFLRTGVLEPMVREGKLAPGKLKVIGQQDLPGFPWACSTRLYPEWPFVALPHVDENLARRVAVALLSIEHGGETATTCGIHGFAIPADYSSVEELLRTLRLPPFEATPEFTVRDVWSRYRRTLVGLGVAGALVLLLSTLLFLNNRRLAAARLAARQGEEKLETILDNAAGYIYIKDADYRYSFVNRAVAELFGRAAGEVVGRQDSDFFDDATAARLRANDRRVIDGGEIVRELESNVDRRSGLRRVYLSTKIPLRRPDGSVYALCGISTDVTEQREMEEALRLALDEKDVLLREVHHRVKNNMQVISSLLNLQALTNREPEAAVGLAELRDRVRAMALVHERLYITGNFAEIDFLEYLRDLARSLLTTNRPAGRRVSVDVVDAPPIFLSIDQAIPCGLVVTELVTNSLKHAFADRSRGRVTVSLTLQDEELAVLEVADDGVGLPDGQTFEGTATLGLRLVGMLAGQLGGRLRQVTGDGTRIRLEFRRQLVPGGAS